MELPAPPVTGMPFLYHVMLGWGTPRAMQVSTRVLLLFTSRFVRFWLSHGCCLSAPKEKRIIRGAVAVFVLFKTVTSQMVQGCFLLSFECKLCSHTLLLTIHTKCSGLKFRPIVELVCLALVTCSAVFGHIMQVKRTGDGVVAEH